MAIAMPDNKRVSLEKTFSKAEASNNCLIPIELDNNSVFTYRFYACWEMSDTLKFNAVNFETYMKSELLKYNKPIQITIKSIL